MGGPLYQIEGLRSLVTGKPQLFAGALAAPVVSRTVVFLGFTSLLTDISSEMVSSILPQYLVLYLSFTPLQFGIVDGLYHGVSALLRIVGSISADRWHRHKEIAAAGYALSALCKLGLLAAGGALGMLLTVLFLDRLGKGIRTAPRDALIALSTPRENLATAFGVHRALDSVGAMLGPLVAFALLSLIAGAFDVIFVVSFCVALMGLGVLVLFVENASKASPERPRVTLSRAFVVGQLRGTRFPSLVFAGSALALCTVSDGFLYLTLHERMGFSAGLLPLLYVVTALIYFIMAIPIGRLADKVGRPLVFLGGYVLLLGIYALLLMPISNYLILGLCLLLFGVYYAATDGVLVAMTSAVLPHDLQATGLGVLSTAITLASFLGSVMFGALWTWWGLRAAPQFFFVGLLIALVLTTIVFLRTRTGGDIPAELHTA